MTTPYRSRRSRLAATSTALRSQGFSWVDIARHIQRKERVPPLVAFRLARGFTQRQVADEWNALYVGADNSGAITDKQISYWETWPSSGHEPSLKTLRRLSRIFQCSISELVEDGNYTHLDAARCLIESSPEEVGGTTAYTDDDVVLHCSPRQLCEENASEEPLSHGKPGDNEYSVAECIALDLREDEDTQRRSFLKLATVAALAAETSRQIASADPDPLTIADVEDDVEKFAVSYATTPHSVLLPQVERRWIQVDRALGGRTTLGAQERLTLAAGRLSYYLSRLAFNYGNFTDARRFSVLSEQYARQTQDRVILGSLAGMMSGIAYYRHQYDNAVSVFANYPADPPYLVARNAAYRARAYGRLGNIEAAREELHVMRHSLADGIPQPGDLPLTEAASWMFTASTLAFCGEGVHAETFARRSIAAHEASGIGKAFQEEWANALLSLAFALLQREHPVVDEAAITVVQAIDLVDDYPTHTVIQRAGELAARLHEHRALPAVADLGERLAISRRPSLPGGSQ